MLSLPSGLSRLNPIVLWIGHEIAHWWTVCTVSCSRTDTATACPGDDSNAYAYGVEFLPKYVIFDIQHAMQHSIMTCAMYFVIQQHAMQRV